MLDIKKDILLEIGCEEIPTTYVLPALENMEKIFADFCATRRIDFDGVETYATPRRLTLIARGVSGAQKDQLLEIKGPPAKAAVASDGKFTQVAEKFVAGRGAKLKELVVRSTDKGEYVFIVKKEKGAATIKVLPELLPLIVQKIEFPKSMRWGAYKMRFARPIRWVAFLYGEKAVTVALDGVKSGRATMGHRFTHNKKINLPSPAEYFTVMEENHVLVDHNERRRRIENAVRAAVDGNPLISDKLLNDVLFLVEYPHVGVGSFDEKFLRLPREALTLSIEKNQHYFPVEDAATGKLLPHFCVVMNVPLENSPDVIAGYEKVLLSRLQDALFFYDNDMKTPLEDRIEALGKITFQKELGSLLDKSHRVQKLVALLAEKLCLGAEVSATAERAARLCKTDLTTSLVFEFTDLQGIAGKYYALSQGNSPEVANAIEEHYKPRFADDELPKSIPGSILALADKADTIAGYISVGLIPTGSEDPFQLRRQSLGVLRILESLPCSFKVEQLMDLAMDCYGPEIIPSEKREGIMKAILDLFDERLRNYMKSRGAAYDIVNAIDFRRVHSIRHAFMCASAITSMREREEFQGMLEVFTRVSNIMKKSATEKDFTDGGISPELLSDAPEKALFEERNRIALAWGADEPDTEEEYRRRMSDLITLTSVAHDFFDHVLVMAEDPAVRANRLALLRSVQALYLRIADFRKIVKG